MNQILTFTHRSVLHHRSQLQEQQICITSPKITTATLSNLIRQKNNKDTIICLAAAKKSKGFGKSTKNKPSTDSLSEKSNDVKMSTSVVSEVPSTTARITATSTTTPVQVKQQEDPKLTKKLNAGQVALEKMRRERAEAKDAELRKVREMLQADEQIRKRPSTTSSTLNDSESGSTAASIPEKVAIRMGKRMIPFVGIPLFLAMGTFVGFWYMATYRGLEFQPALVAASTIILLFLSLVVRTSETLVGDIKIWCKLSWMLYIYVKLLC
jgi:Photosynthesis affected mutant 68